MHFQCKNQSFHYEKVSSLKTKRQKRSAQNFFKGEYLLSNQLRRFYKTTLLLLEVCIV